MMKEIEKLTMELYAAPLMQSCTTLYITFAGLLGIVQSRYFKANDISHMNDSAGLIHTAGLIKVDVGKRLDNGHPLFGEEKEWGIVFPVITSAVDSSVLFREGDAMQVLSIESDLCVNKGPLVLDHLLLGPAASTNISCIKRKCPKAGC